MTSPRETDPTTVFGWGKAACQGTSAGAGAFELFCAMINVELKPRNEVGRGTDMIEDLNS
jgi:hypothetical protein